LYSYSTSRVEEEARDLIIGASWKELRHERPLAFANGLNCLSNCLILPLVNA
jgi:hypothetical protein